MKKFSSAAGYDLSDLHVICIVSSVVYSGLSPIISGTFCGFTVKRKLKEVSILSMMLIEKCIHL